MELPGPRKLLNAEKLLSADRLSLLPLPSAVIWTPSLGTLIVASPDRFTVPPANAFTCQKSAMLPRVVRADRSSVLFTPVASKVESCVSASVVRFGRPRVPRLCASRLEPFTSVRPANVYEPPVTVREPLVMVCHWLITTVPVPSRVI